MISEKQCRTRNESKSKIQFLHISIELWNSNYGDSVSIPASPFPDFRRHCGLSDRVAQAWSVDIRCRVDSKVIDVTKLRNTSYFLVTACQNIWKFSFETLIRSLCDSWTYCSYIYKKIKSFKSFINCFKMEQMLDIVPY